MTIYDQLVELIESVSAVCYSLSFRFGCLLFSFLLCGSLIHDFFLIFPTREHQYSFIHYKYTQRYKPATYVMNGQNLLRLSSRIKRWA
jgi:hypothetical protein